MIGSTKSDRSCRGMKKPQFPSLPELFIFSQSIVSLNSDALASTAFFFTVRGHLNNAGFT